MSNSDPPDSTKTTRDGNHDGGLNRLNGVGSLPTTGADRNNEPMGSNKRAAAGQTPSQADHHNPNRASPCTDQQTSHLYTPLQRWQQEGFHEQPWHGIARELMIDGWADEYFFGNQDGAEAAISKPFKRGGGGRNEGVHEDE